MFFLLVGAPAVGKSTWAKNRAENLLPYSKSLIVSSDGIRNELWGDEAIQGDPKTVFEIAHSRILKAIEEGYDNVIFDATNMTHKDRMAIMNKVNKLGTKSTCVVFAEPYDVLCKRNGERARQVPEYVIWNMIKRFEAPLKSEGYDEIYVINRNPVNLAPYIHLMRGFEQDNSNHAFDLYTHCKNAADYILSHYPEEEDGVLATAAMLHDIGKPFTKTFTNMKGEKTEEAHYYGHEKVGAYLSLTFRTNWGPNQLQIAQLICYHMMPYFIETPRAEKRWKERLGNLYEKVMRLHKADEAAH